MNFECHGVYFGECDYQCVLDLEAVQVNNLGRIIKFVDFIKGEPCDVEFNLILHVLQIIIVHDLLFVFLLLWLQVLLIRFKVQLLFHGVHFCLDLLVEVHSHILSISLALKRSVRILWLRRVLRLNQHVSLDILRWPKIQRIGGHLHAGCVVVETTNADDWLLFITRLFWQLRLGYPFILGWRWCRWFEQLIPLDRLWWGLLLLLLVLHNDINRILIMQYQILILILVRRVESNLILPLTSLDILRSYSIGLSAIGTSLHLTGLLRLLNLRRRHHSGLLLLTVCGNLPVLYLLKIYLTLAGHFVTPFLAAEWEILVRKLFDTPIDCAHLG